jgi:hypothetical protein
MSVWTSISLQSSPVWGRAQGLGLTPPMGYSSWNDCGSTPNETWVKRTARYLIDSGLAAKGYTCADAAIPPGQWRGAG